MQQKLCLFLNDPSILRKPIVHSFNETSLKYFHIVLFVIKHALLNFESVDEILWCDHSTETSSVVLSNAKSIYKHVV